MNLSASLALLLATESIGLNKDTGQRMYRFAGNVPILSSNKFPHTAVTQTKEKARRIKQLSKGMIACN
jgi:hypothetical protein